MPAVTLVYWRDIPAQVIVGKGRRGAKRPLPERFETAIDRCAMKVGAKDDDAYMSGFRKAPPMELPGEAEDLAQEWAEKLDSDYDARRLQTLIAADGWDTTTNADAP
ncbi:MAG: virulence factor [Pseudomonadota bacterium]